MSNDSRVLQTTSMSNSKRGYMLAALTVAIWSGFILMSRLGGANALTPYDLIALRFGTAAIILIPLSIIWRPAQLFSWKMTGLMLTGGILYSVLVYCGIKFAPAAHASILLPGLLPFETALFSWLLQGERPSAERVLGLFVIAGGVSFLALNAYTQGGQTWLGDIMLVGASLSWALYTVLTRRWGISPRDATMGGALLTAAIYLPIYFIFLPKNIASAPISMVLWQAFYQGFLVVIVAMLLYMQAVALIGATRMGSLMAMVPAISGVLAVPILGEALPFSLIAGLFLVSLGAYLGSGAKLPILRRTQCPT